MKVDDYYDKHLRIALDLTMNEYSPIKLVKCDNDLIDSESVC